MEDLDAYGFLFHFLHFFGFLYTMEESVYRIVIRIVSYSLLILIYMDYLGMCAYNYETYLTAFRSMVPFTGSYTISFLILYIMYRRKKRITNLMKFFLFKHKSICSLKLNKYFMFILISNMSIFLASIVFDLKKYYFLKWYSYGISTKTDTALKYCIAITRFGLQLFLHPLFVNLISLLYCALCHRIVTVIVKSTTIVEFRKHTLHNTHLIRIIKNRSEIVESVKYFQKEFSVIISLACLSNFLSCFGILSIIMASKFTSYVDIFVEIIFFFINNLLNLIAVIFCAGQIPEEMERLYNALQNVSEYQTSLTPELIRAITYKPNVVLSASNLLFFTKDSILCVIGNLLTYGLLFTSIFQ